MPVTNCDTSYSTQLFVGTAPLSSAVALVRGGRLFQLTAVSLQAGFVVNTAGPSTVPLYAYTRSVALRTLPVGAPLTLKRSRLSTEGAPELPSTRRKLVA